MCASHKSRFIECSSNASGIHRRNEGHPRNEAFRNEKPYEREAHMSIVHQKHRLNVNHSCGASPISLRRQKQQSSKSCHVACFVKLTRGDKAQSWLLLHACSPSWYLNISASSHARNLFIFLPSCPKTVKSRPQDFSDHVAKARLPRRKLLSDVNVARTHRSERFS